jgi:hypothetical protein
MLLAEARFLFNPKWNSRNIIVIICDNTHSYK